MPKFHDTDVNMMDALDELIDSHDLDHHRIELYMTDGTRYWITAIQEEWSDAVLVRQETGRETLVMKHTVQAIEPIPRPMSKEKRDE